MNTGLIVTIIVSSIGLISLIILTIALLRNYKEQKIEKIKNPENATFATEEKHDLKKELAQKAEKIVGAIRPESNQQRNLDRETGGLEEEKKEKKTEPRIEDVWDNRSEEVDKMGSVNPLRGDDKESMIWVLKKDKKEEMKLEKAAVALEAHHELKKHGKGFDSSNPTQQGFASKIKALKQDRSNEGNDGQNGGAYR